jgi:hypothetical protein
VPALFQGDRAIHAFVGDEKGYLQHLVEGRKGMHSHLFEACCFFSPSWTQWCEKGEKGCLRYFGVTKPTNWWLDGGKVYLSTW